MREMYCGYASFQILYSERGDCERNKRKLQWVCCRLYPFICWIIKRKDLAISLVDIPTLGEPRIYVSLLYCVSSMFYFHNCFYFISLQSSLCNRDILQTSYQGMDKVKTSKLQILKRDFETVSMKD
jgi:hypothetical protein